MYAYNRESSCYYIIFSHKKTFPLALLQQKVYIGLHWSGFKQILRITSTMWAVVIKMLKTDISFKAQQGPKLCSDLAVS